MAAKHQLKEVFMQIQKISNSGQNHIAPSNNYSDTKKLALPKEISMGSNAKLALSPCGGWPLPASAVMSSIKHI